MTRIRGLVTALLLVGLLGVGACTENTVSKASFGAVHDWRLAENLRFGVGALYSLNQVPAALEPAYGGDPDGGMVFVRLKID